jgi:phosphoglycerate dehydrogenase-like enzyme
VRAFPAARALVLVTEPEFRKAPDVFTSSSTIECVAAPSDEGELAAAIASRGARHAIIGHLPYRNQLYESLPRGAVLARFGVGYESIDLARATAAGLLCTNTPGVLDQSVAELTMLLIAGAARHFVAIAGRMREREWTPQTGRELAGKTLAIIGSGRIGQAVARIAAGGYHMRVIGCRRTPAVAEPPFHTMTTDFSAAVREADFVSLHMPASPANRRFIDRERLAAIRPEAWLINTARGAVVDEAALYDALAARQLAGAALDVFEREPYEPIDPSHDLRTLSNVILTPHSGSNTTEANRGMAARAVANVEFGVRGEFGQMDLLNREVVTLT